MNHTASRFLITATFALGFSTMTLELVASRIMAPHFGTSFVVWTNLIGVILGSLSLGYFAGGRFADRRASNTTVSKLLIAATALFGILLFAYRPLPLFFSRTVPYLPVSSGLSSLFLFGPVNVLYGILTPFFVRLYIRNTRREGAAVGNLYAVSAIGNIVGVFATGYFLIPRLGIHTILVALFVLHLVLSVAGYGALRWKTFFLLLAVTPLLTASYIIIRPAAGTVYETDTLYNHILVFMANPGRLMKILKINNDYSSAAFPHSRDLAFEYTKFFRLSAYFNPGIRSALMIGGGAYSYPMQYLRDFPAATMTAVELDPGVTDTAVREFGLENSDRLTLVHDDGRRFLNRDTATYDAVYIDAFDNNAVPFPLTTVEAVRQMAKRLNRNGMVMLNIIGTLEGQGSAIIRAEYETYRAVFPSVYLFPVHGYAKPRQLQAMMLVAFKTKTGLVKNSGNKEYRRMLQNEYSLGGNNRPSLLSDDYAPVEYYVSKTY